MLLIDDSLPTLQTRGTQFRIPMRTVCTPLRATTSSAAALIAREKLIPIEAMMESIRLHVGDKVSLYQKDIETLLPLLSR
jgi:hypothetical protein